LKSSSRFIVIIVLFSIFTTRFLRFSFLRKTLTHPMKRNRTSSLKSPQQVMVLGLTGSYLPDECWECILKSFIKDERRRYLNSLSLVSKQLLSITDSFRFSLTVYDQTHPFLGRLFKRFTNLTSHYRCDLDALLIHVYWRNECREFLFLEGLF